MIAGAVDETNVAIGAMVKQALEEKSRNLPRWRKDFTRSWLLILNCYPIVSEISEVNSVVKRLACEGAVMTDLDGIFWSGYPDRKLTQISFTEFPTVGGNVAPDRT